MKTALKITIALAALTGAVLFTANRFSAYRESKRHEFKVALSSGDTLALEVDWWGREPFLNDSAPHMRLFVDWKDLGVRELVSDHAYIGVEPNEQCRLHRSADTIIIQTPQVLYHRPVSQPLKWREWNYRSFNRDSLYDYLVKRSKGVPNSQFIEVKTERGTRFTLPLYSSYTWLGDSKDDTWSLPYWFDEIDISANRLSMKLKHPVIGLPKKLWFTGPSGDVGEWSFNATLTRADEIKDP